MRTRLIKLRSTALSIILIVKYQFAILLLGVGCTQLQEREFVQTPIPEDAAQSALEPGKPSGIFIRTEIGELATLNPLVAEDRSSSAAIGLMSGALTEFDWVDEEIIPGLAKSWDISEDQKTFTFHLRKGVHWSNGAPFSADDVIFSYKCYYDDRFPNRSKFYLTINGKPCEIIKIDDYTVQITAPEIYAPFLLFVAGQGILPRHILEESFDDGTLLKQWSISTAKNNPEKIASLGPFVLQSYRPGERIVFARNPNYYKIDKARVRLPYIKYLIAKMVSDSNASTVTFAQGQTDVESIGPGDLAWVERAMKKQDFRIINRGPAPSITFIWFNLNPGKNADGNPFVEEYKLAWFQNQKFRQAVCYGTNREGIIEGVLFGRGAPLHSSVTPANRRWHNPNVHKYPYNPDKSKELLISEGFFYKENNVLYGPNGNRVAITLETNKDNNTRTEIATVFKENMAHLGIDINLQFIDFNTLVVKITDSFDYECSLLGLGGGVSDPAASLDIYSSAGRMHMWYPSQKSPATEWEARIDKLMGLQVGTLDFNERKQYMDEVQMIMSEQVPFILLISPNAYVGIKNKWQGVKVPTMGGVIWNIDELWALEK